MRSSWDSYFIRIANAVSTRGTCDRKRVGSVIVRENRIIATGYNGSIPGLPHCSEVGHDMYEGSCVRTSHSEINSLAQAAKYGNSVQGASIYINTFPCWNCFKALVSSGIQEVVYSGGFYKSFASEKVYGAAASLKEKTGFILREYDSTKEVGSAVLVGSIENSEDLGRSWREEITERLEEIGVVTINPLTIEEGKGFFTPEEKKLKDTDLELFKKRMRDIILLDINHVDDADFVIFNYNDEKIAGTIGEITHATITNKPVYIIYEGRIQDLPMWVIGCITKQFNNQQELVSYLKTLKN